ncbi:Mitochondrial inner membrane protein oxa1 [Tulasnella sp. 331]|nr:Mitochondrial inner membrane protein oxa1 [Tulasnella sp. 331]
MALPRTQSLARFTGLSSTRANVASRSLGIARSIHLNSKQFQKPQPLISSRFHPTFVPVGRSYWWSPAPNAPATSTSHATSTRTDSIPEHAISSSPLLEPSVLLPAGLDTPDSVPSATTPSLDNALAPPIDGSITELLTSPSANGDNIGDLASLGLGGWSPAGIVQTLLEQIHVTTGLPWWASILTLAAVIRIASLPLHIRVVANNSRMAYATKKVKEATEKIKASQAAGDKMALMKASMQMRQAYTDVGASPLVGLLGLVQMPIGIAMFFGIKWMCNFPVESMKTGGLAWFTDLTMSDPTYVMPIISTAAFIAMLKLASAETPKAQETKHITNAFVLISLVGMPIMAQLPTGLMLYFVCNGALMGLQAAILRIPAVKRWANIRPPPPTSEIILAPSMKETVLAGYKKFKSLHENKFEQIAANAVAKANRDMKKREQEARDAARKVATPKQEAVLAQRKGMKSKSR